MRLVCLCALALGAACAEPAPWDVTKLDVEIAADGSDWQLRLHNPTSEPIRVDEVDVSGALESACYGGVIEPGGTLRTLILTAVQQRPPLDLESKLRLGDPNTRSEELRRIPWDRWLRQSYIRVGVRRSDPYAACDFDNPRIVSASDDAK